MSMVLRASKPCRVHGCPHVRPCPIDGHEPKPWEGSTRSRELPPDWEKRRRHVLERDPICTICDAALSTEVHHTGDKHDHRVEMLAGVCDQCHQRETLRQAAEARARKR